MRLFTIGFTGKDAESFFEALKSANVKRVIDIRRSNTSQLAGFTKKSDLPYLLGQVGGITYVHEPELAPTTDLFRSLRSGKIAWREFDTEFRQQLVEARRAGELKRSAVVDSCLLCACSGPERCHRSIVASILAQRFPGLTVKHL